MNPSHDRGGLRWLRAGPEVLLALASGACQVRAADPVVSHVQAMQRPGTQLVDITYDLADPDSDVLHVCVAVSDTGGATYSVPAIRFSGDVGSGVAPGRGRRMVWDAGRDWPGRFSANVRFKVTATDPEVAPPPDGMVLIPAGSFRMGDSFGEGNSDEKPVHTVFVSAFYLDRTEVTKARWDEVYVWAIHHGYGFDHRGDGKAPDHPVQFVNWHDVVKWCNARSEMEGRVPAYYLNAAHTQVYRDGQADIQNDWVEWNAGYRLPTEAEWEKAARGGLSGRRFPWGDTISHRQANYSSNSSYAYDLSPTRGYHPDFKTGGMPYTSPAGHFAPNGYGLYDLTGNVWEWCWDGYSGSYYGGSPPSDPRGPGSGSHRVIRGGGWGSDAGFCRVANRNYHGGPLTRGYNLGFRSVLPPSQPRAERASGAARSWPGNLR